MMYLLLLPLGLLLALICFGKFFLRNPDRNPPRKDVLVAPADGKIIAITPFDAKTVHFHKGNRARKGSIYTLTDGVAQEGYVISIFMSVLNVHYNRSPYDGQVTGVRHTSGTFIPAQKPQARLQNEKTEITIESDRLKVKVIQIAGFLARRIETYVQKNDRVRTGQILGRINFGSQVTLILPAQVSIAVKLGDKVKAGESIIAYPD